MIYAGCPSSLHFGGWRIVIFQASGFYCMFAFMDMYRACTYRDHFGHLEPLGFRVLLAAASRYEAIQGGILRVGNLASGQL